MKKFLLLLFTVFLLLPIAIYFGNLGDLPTAKKVVVYLRDLAGMSTSKELTDSSETENIKVPAPYNHIGLVESWRDLGRSGFTDLLQITAAQGEQETWKSTAESILNDSLHSAAFFSSSWSFWQSSQEKLKLVGYYQPWLDVFLLMQIVEINGSDKVVAIGITESSGLLTANTTASMEQTLTARLQRAEQLFQSATQNPDTIDTMLNATAVEKAKTNSKHYVSDLRNKLSAEHGMAILTWLDALRAGQISDIQASSDWLSRLQPVQLIKVSADNWLIAVSTPEQPERILLAHLHITNHETQVTEVKIWDAASAGGVQ